MDVGVKIIIQLVSSLILVQVPVAVLRGLGLKASHYLAFVTIFACSLLGGLIFAAPTTFLLMLYCLWVSFLGSADRGAKRTLFFVTLGLGALFLTIQILHLPIRFALQQPAPLIWANVVGILLALCLLVTPTELALVQKRSLVGIGAGGDSSDEFTTAIVDDDPVGTSLRQNENSPAGALKPVAIPLEDCPYCEQAVIPDTDGRCPACRRPIA